MDTDGRISTISTNIHHPRGFHGNSFHMECIGKSIETMVDMVDMEDIKDMVDIEERNGDW